MKEKESPQLFKIAGSGCSPAEVLLFPCSGGSSLQTLLSSPIWA